MRVTNENVEQVIDRFMEGQTSNAEEAALYRFFREEDIPERLKMYKPMFAYFAGGMKEEDLPSIGKNKITSSTTLVPMESLPRENGKVWRWKRVVWPLVSGVAACFIGVTLFTHYEQQQELYSSYSGSYVIEHGRRLSDIRSIMPRLESVEAHADAAEARHQAAQVTANVLGEINDPSVRAAAAEALK